MTRIAKRIYFVLASALGLIAACEVQHHNPVSPPNSHPTLPDVRVHSFAGMDLVSQGYLTQEQVLQSNRIGQGLAAVLQDAALRLRLRDNMRDSPFREHKLILQDYVASDPELLSALSSAIEVSPRELSSLLSSIPEMDFYLAFKDHRLTWQGTADLRVGVTLNVDSSIFDAYDAEGNHYVLDARDGTPAVPIVFIHPSERKYLRDDYSRGTGSTVEDSSSIPGPRFQMCSDPEFCGGGGPSTVTVFGNFIMYYGDGVGDNEPIYSFQYRYLGGVIRENTLEYGNKDDGVWHIANDVLWPGGYQGGDQILIHLVEDDAFMDDDWGDGLVSSLGEFNSIIEIVGSCAALGDPNDQPCDEDPFMPGFTVTSHITLYM